MEQLLASSHRVFPFKTLRLVTEPDLADEIATEASDDTCKGGWCDPWTKALYKQFNSVEQLLSKAFQAVLILALMLMWIRTGTIETLHASIRRMILGPSTQSSQRDFADAQCA